MNNTIHTDTDLIISFDDSVLSFSPTEIKITKRMIAFTCLAFNQNFINCSKLYEISLTSKAFDIQEAKPYNLETAVLGKYKFGSIVLSEDNGRLGAFSKCAYKYIKV